MTDKNTTTTTEETLKTILAPVDIKETQDAYIVYADMPGIDPEKMNIQLDHETLHVEAESRIPELHPARYERVFRVIRGLDPDKVTADYKNGVLKIVLTKPKTMQPRKITVTTE